MQGSTNFRICFVADAADIHTQRWAKYFSEKGQEVHLISIRPPSENLENINLHLLRTFGMKTKILKYMINPTFLREGLKVVFSLRNKEEAKEFARIVIGIIKSYLNIRKTAREGMLK